VSPAGGLTLALDAARSEGTVAVLRDGALVATREVVMRSRDGEHLMPAVLAALAEAGAGVTDLSRVVAGEGPGSFTSLRVAGAIAKGLAHGTGCPLFAVPSLALLVAASPATAVAGPWLATLDAMRGDKYLALVTVGDDGAVVTSRALGLAPAAAVAARAEELGARLVGPGEAVDASPHARGLVRCVAMVLARGRVDLAAWEPVYGRLAEAQAKREREAPARASRDA
jgi:tRNA threonylcarbamoyladenosine biosynthesis protein TsaB